MAPRLVANWCLVAAFGALSCGVTERDFAGSESLGGNGTADEAAGGSSGLATGAAAGDAGQSSQGAVGGTGEADEAGEAGEAGKAGAGPGCEPASVRPCVEAGLLGPCAAGYQTCEDGAWSACSVAPGEDSCEPDNDDDCSGTPADGCECLEGVTERACGACGDGTQVCENGRANEYGTCVGDQAVPNVFYRDADGDGFGDPGMKQELCSDVTPKGYVTKAGDCCDDGGNLVLAATINPAQTAFFDKAANLCGVTWDYDCKSGVETSPKESLTSCGANCSAQYSPVGADKCGGYVAACGCSNGSSCTFNCAAGIIVRCR